jgi:hypothetical protein
MTENNEPSTEGKAHTSSRNPALEGDSGQYVGGDYGDAGPVADVPADEKKGEYSEGDYGTAGTAPEQGPADDLKDELIEGQVNAPASGSRNPASGSRRAKRGPAAAMASGFPPASADGRGPFS